MLHVWHVITCKFRKTCTAWQDKLGVGRSAGGSSVGRWVRTGASKTIYWSYHLGFRCDGYWNIDPCTKIWPYYRIPGIYYTACISAKRKAQSQRALFGWLIATFFLSLLCYICSFFSIPFFRSFWFVVPTPPSPSPGLVLIERTQNRTKTLFLQPFGAPEKKKEKKRQRAIYVTATYHYDTKPTSSRTGAWAMYYMNVDGVLAITGLRIGLVLSIVNRSPFCRFKLNKNRNRQKWRW